LPAAFPQPALGTGSLGAPEADGIGPAELAKEETTDGAADPGVDVAAGVFTDADAVDDTAVDGNVTGELVTTEGTTWVATLLAVGAPPEVALISPVIPVCPLTELEGTEDCAETAPLPGGSAGSLHAAARPTSAQAAPVPITKGLNTRLESP
jgi:hypothetical protein